MFCVMNYKTDQLEILSTQEQLDDALSRDCRDVTGADMCHVPMHPPSQDSIGTTDIDDKKEPEMKPIIEKTKPAVAEKPKQVKKKTPVIKKKATTTKKKSTKE